MQKLSCLNLPWPADWTALFGAERPLIVEIGFGNGDHLLHLARQQPQAGLVGIEIANQSMEKAEKKIASEGLDNVLVVHGAAETALHHLLEPASVEAFHINYPDPWFKKRHHGRRLMQRDTLDALTSRLRPGGLLYLATDIVEYAQMSHELLAATPGLENTLETPWVHELPGRFTTKYEARGLQQGRPGHYFVYRRNNRPAPDVPVYRELDMPHIIIKSPLPLRAALENFRKAHHMQGETSITLLHAYINRDESTLLVEARVQEATISQHLALLVLARQEPQHYIVQLGSMGPPRVTQGLHRAVGLLADWLVSLHPDARVVESRARV